MIKISFHFCTCIEIKTKFKLIFPYLIFALNDYKITCGCDKQQFHERQSKYNIHIRVINI